MTAFFRAWLLLSLVGHYSLLAIGKIPTQCSELIHAEGVPQYVEENFSFLEKNTQQTIRLYEKIRAAEPEFAAHVPFATISYLAWDPAFHYLIPNLHHLLYQFQKMDKSRSVAERWFTVLNEFGAKANTEFWRRRLASGQRTHLNSKNPLYLANVLGRRSRRDVQTLLYGDDFRHPTRTSLIGQYLAKTGATTLLRRFGKTATGGGAGEQNNQKFLGPQRLVISLSERSYPVYKKLFSEPYFLVHAHTPNQGTLYTGFEGVQGSYAETTRKSKAVNSDLSVTPGAIWPHILLSTTEAGRTRRYMDLVRKEPWVLKGYCATGAYNSCTHWFGEMPIGDRKVDRLAFPGYIDDYASNSVSTNPRINRKPRVSKLKAYPQEEDPKVDFWMRQVWQYPNSPMQLYEKLGLLGAGLEGEFANPGWIAIRLTGSASNEDVPFVFYVTEDHTQPIPEDLPTTINAK